MKKCYKCMPWIGDLGPVKEIVQTPPPIPPQIERLPDKQLDLVVPPPPLPPPIKLLSDATLNMVTPPPLPPPPQEIEKPSTVVKFIWSTPPIISQPKTALSSINGVPFTIESNFDIQTFNRVYNAGKFPVGDYKLIRGFPPVVISNGETLEFNFGVPLLNPLVLVSLLNGSLLFDRPVEIEFGDFNAKRQNGRLNDQEVTEQVSPLEVKSVFGDTYATMMVPGYVNSFKLTYSTARDPGDAPTTVTLGSYFTLPAL